MYSPDFEEAYKKDEDARRIIDSALSIEGLHRGEGVHACAVLIAPTTRQRPRSDQGRHQGRR